MEKINTQNKKQQKARSPSPHLRIYTGIVSNEQATIAEEIEYYDFDLVSNEINYEINKPISENEILHAVHSLKTNKDPELDGIVNEQIKSTITYMSAVYVKVSYISFDSGIMSDAWTIGNIKPM